MQTVAKALFILLFSLSLNAYAQSARSPDCWGWIGRALTSVSQGESKLVAVQDRIRNQIRKITIPVKNALLRRKKIVFEAATYDWAKSFYSNVGIQDLEKGPINESLEHSVAWVDASMERFAGNRTYIDTFLKKAEVSRQEKLLERVRKFMKKPQNELETERFVNDIFFLTRTHSYDELSKLPIEQISIQQSLNREIAKDGLITSMKRSKLMKPTTTFRGATFILRYQVWPWVSLRIPKNAYQSLPKEWVRDALLYGVESQSKVLAKAYPQKILRRAALGKLKIAVNRLSGAILARYIVIQSQLKIKKQWEDLEKAKKLQNETGDLKTKVDDLTREEVLSAEDVRIYGDDPEFKAMAEDQQKANPEHYLPGSAEFELLKKNWYSIKTEKDTP